MTDADVLAWASGGGALLAALVAAFPWLRGHVHADLFAKMVHKLLAAGNPDRAIKLCNAAPNAPFVVACGAALRAVVDSDGQAPSEVLRNGKDAFDRTLRDELAKAGKTAWVALIAMALAGVAGYFVLLENGSPYALILAAIAFSVIFHARRLAYKIAIAAATHRDALVEAMAKARAGAQPS